MFEDRNGNELHPGDVVGVRFVVTNVVEDSERRNIVVRHFDPMTGCPDDYRLTLDAQHVERLKPARHSDPVPEDPKPEPGPEEEPISATPAT